MVRNRTFGIFLIASILLLSFCFADTFSQDSLLALGNGGCGDAQFKCDCGQPKCIDKSLYKNGVKDCEDGSDEGEWDPSKCAIKNRTSEDIRFKRAAIPDFLKDATTTFFSHDRARTRPVGLLSTSLGAFVTSGTTTEYLTKILGTYIKGTYARIISTSSKVYHAVPTDSLSGSDSEIRPTGFIASTTSTEVNGYATTVHATDFYRTYIDGTYAQLVSSSSSIKYPSWYSEQIIDPTLGSLEATKVYSTSLPTLVRGNFVNVLQSNAYANLGLVAEEQKNQAKLKALRPNNNPDNELKVRGTHGKFIHTDKDKGDETTYNVFTGSYIQNSKTFLFFFGNTVIDPTRSVDTNLEPTLMVENGAEKKGGGVVVDMRKNLKVLVPLGSSRVKVDGIVGGEDMEGVLVEIQGSEDEFMVDGAREMETPSHPRIDMITVTLDKKTRRTSSSSSSSSSSRGGEGENEIPQGRKAPSKDDIQPSRSENVALPTFTVGQPDPVQFEEGADDVSTPKTIVKYVETSSKSSTAGGISGGGRPVFQKGGSEKSSTSTPLALARSTERIRALGYTQEKKTFNNGINLNGKYPMPNRNHRAFSAFDKKTPKSSNELEGDLQTAASTGRATVTYVGFADFTTTVGNTVIVFMPRTKMIEDLNVHASKTVEPSIEPTRYVYHTTTDDDVPSSTTPRGDGDDDNNEHVQFSVSQVQNQGRKVHGSSTPISFKDDDDESTTENPSTTTQSVSGRETIFPVINSSPVYKPKVKSSSATALNSNDRRNSLFSSPRAKFTPKSSLASKSSASATPSTYQTASTVVLQTDVLNPTGLVTSVDGTIVKDGKTTLYTSLVFGTFIGKSYAQVIKSTSKVLKEPSQIVSEVPSIVKSSIRPTSVAKLPSSRGSSTAARQPIYYEFSTTTQSSKDDDAFEETTTTSSNNNVDLDRMEVSVSSTTERAKDDEDDKEETTLPSVDLQTSFDDDEFTTTTTTTERDLDNEIGRKRKVIGKAKDQIIVDLEPSSGSEGTGDDEEDQTIFVTRTLPTTVYRTYTYYTTFFIPEEGSTSTKVVSREVTSSAVGLVRKTFTSVLPSASVSADASNDDEVKSTKEQEKKPIATKVKPSRGKASGAQVIYKTLFTTYTYLTTFFSGQTSSVSSREETISNVITSTSAIGSKATTSVKITPTGSLRSRTYKTASPRLSQGGTTNVGVSSPSPSSSSGGSRSSLIRRQKLSSSLAIQKKKPEAESESSADEIEYQSVTKTLLRTFMTTYTYFTTLFNGDDTSIKSRTEVITNIVPYVTKTLAPILSTTAPEDYEDEAAASAAKDEFSSSTAFKMSNNKKNKVKETTFYTTYTYLSTIISGRSSTIKTSKQTYTNIIVGDSTIRSGYIEPIEPTKLSGRSAGAAGAKATRKPKFQQPKSQDDEDLNEVGSHLSETSETTLKTDDEGDVTTFRPSSSSPEYELEGSEDAGVTTNRPHNSGDDDDDDNDVLTKEKTPLLKTIYTTFTFYTTYYKGGTSTVSSRLETKSQLVTDTNGLSNEEDDVTVTDKAPLLSTIDPTYPVTYFTTYTYWTTSFKDGNSVVTSREETITNVVTPGADDIAPSSSLASIKETDGNNEIVPSSSHEVELTTFYTTYTYFTTSYLNEKTIVNSRLETVTNVITGTPFPTPSQTGRAIGSAVRPSEQKITGNDKDTKDEYDVDYVTPTTGLLSTIVSSEVNLGTTTIFSTDVFGTLIDGIYAQVLESTSSIIKPTAVFTRYFPEATETPTGVVSVNEGKTVEANKDRTTYFATTAYGTVIDGKYAHLVESTGSIKGGAGLEGSEDFDSRKTGLVRVIDGTLVEGDHTTFYTSSILGTFIDGQYAQVIESTSRFVISPTKSVGDNGPSRIVDVESSITEGPSSEEDGFTTTTEKHSQEDEEHITSTTEKSKKPIVPPPRRFGLNRGSSSGSRNNSRLSFTGTSKTFTPAITPFASRSRPSGFNPRKRPSVAVQATKVVSASDDSSTSTSTTTPSRGFQSRRRFQKPGDPVGDGTTTPTPALPASRTRGGSRFSKPPVGIKSRFEKTSSSSINPTAASGSSTSGVGGSSPGARGRGGSSFIPRGSSSSRNRLTSSTVNRGSSSSVRGGASSSASRFNPSGRSRSSVIAPSSTATTPVTPTIQSSSSLAPNEEEYEIEYEYESVPSQSSTTTTPAPESGKSGARFGSSNRFRLNPKLATVSSAGGSSKSTTARPITTRGSPLNLRRFSKPTLPTRGTTLSSSSPTEEALGSSSSSSNPEEYESEYEEVSSSTTSKPLKPGFGSKKPLITQRPTSRPSSSSSNNRRVTTTPAPAVQTTTRRIYTPRPRPAGFPRAVGPLGGRSTTTSTSAPSALGPDEEYYEEGEFEYQESKHVPNITSIASSASELSEVIIPMERDVNAIEPNIEGTHHNDEGVRRKRSTSSSSRQVSPIEYKYIFHNNYNNYGLRTARGTLRSNFPSRSPSSNNSPSFTGSSNSNLNSKSNLRPTSNTDYDYEYYYDESPVVAIQPPPQPPTQPPPQRQSPSSRFRGRIQPTTSSSSSSPSRLRTPFTLTPNSNSNTHSTRSRSRTSNANNNPTTPIRNANTNPSSSRAFIPTQNTRSRSQSRYQRPSATEATTTSRTSRFRSRYNSRDSLTTPAPLLRGGGSSGGSSRFGNSLSGRGGRGSISNVEPVFEASSSITVTHYVPAETQIPFVNGKSTEYKTVLTPSPSIQVLGPYQYTQSDYLGKNVLVLQSEMTSTPSFGVTELTRFIIRESPTTSVTFTPTTIRGRKTSFSHIVPSTVYSIENVVTTVTGLLASNLGQQQQDSNQLTNLLLNQLLGQGLLNPNLLQLQQQQQGASINANEPPTPVTQYNTKTTSYVTTVTDFTSTIVRITLHGKPLKSTIVESSTHIITATEFITESTIITPTPLQPQLQLNTQQQQNPLLNNPQLLQLLQLQQQQLLQQQIAPTPAPQLPTPAISLTTQVAPSASTPSPPQQQKEKEQFNQEEESKQTVNIKAPELPKKVEASSTVVTLFVSGKNPGEFSTVLQTVAVSPSSSNRRRRRSADAFIAAHKTSIDFILEPSIRTETMDFYNDNSISQTPPHNNYDNLDKWDRDILLEDSLSYSDPFSNLMTTNREHTPRATDTLESVMGLSSLFTIR